MHYHITLLHYTGCYGKTYQDSFTILSDFFKHSCIMQFYYVVFYGTFLKLCTWLESAEKMLETRATLVAWKYECNYHIQHYYIILVAVNC